MKKPHSAIDKRKARSAQRRILQEALARAVRNKDLDEAEQLQEQLDAIAPKSNGRSSSSVCRDPHDPELLTLYKNKHVHEILAEYGKEIRVDFGFLGMVAGIANLVDASSDAVGESVSSPLRKELARRFARKVVERTHGMGMLYTERANQVIRKLYELPDVAQRLALPSGERPWVRRKTLAESVDFDSDFARRWEDFEAQGVDAEASEDTEAVQMNHTEVDAAETEPAKTDAKPDDAEPDHAEPDHAEPDDAKPDDAEPDHAEPDHAEPDPAPMSPEAKPSSRASDDGDADAAAACSLTLSELLE